MSTVLSVVEGLPRSGRKRAWWRTPEVEDQLRQQATDSNIHAVNILVNGTTALEDARKAQSAAYLFAASLNVEPMTCSVVDGEVYGESAGTAIISIYRRNVVLLAAPVSAEVTV